MNLIDILVSEAKKKQIGQISLEATQMGRPLYEKYGFVSMKDEMELPCSCQKYRRQGDFYLKRSILQIFQKFFNRQRCGFSFAKSKGNVAVSRYIQFFCHDMIGNPF